MTRSESQQYEADSIARARMKSIAKHSKPKQPERNAA